MYSGARCSLLALIQPSCSSGPKSHTCQALLMRALALSYPVQHWMELWRARTRRPRWFAAGRDKSKLLAAQHARLPGCGSCCSSTAALQQVPGAVGSPAAGCTWPGMGTAIGAVEVLVTEIKHPAAIRAASQRPQLVRRTLNAPSARMRQHPWPLGRHNLDPLHCPGFSRPFDDDRLLRAALAALAALADCPHYCYCCCCCYIARPRTHNTITLLLRASSLS